MSINPQIAKSVDENKRSGIALNSGPFEAVVMNNQDSLFSGRLEVYVPEFGGDISNPTTWKIVRYASPFYGITPYRDQQLFQAGTGANNWGIPGGTESRDPGNEGKLNAQNLAGMGGQQSQQNQPITSYGMWAVPPDVGVTVLVMFLNGDLNRGFWFACLPTLAHGMIPAIGAPDGKTPMAEFNPINPEVHTTSDLQKVQREPYEPLVQQLTAQGLQADPVRGPITTSSFRESPSRVLGISSQTGHSFAMDDGTADGTSKLVRIRTAGGNQITMHDDTGMIYFINAQGTGWIELSPSGQIDIFGAAGVNMATNGDINFHADNNINMHANNCIKIVAMNGTKVMGGAELQLHGAKTMIEGVDSLHIHTCNEMMITSFADIHMKAFNYFCLKGKCFYWNSCTAKEAEQVPPEQPADVSGYQTTVARAPSKEPYKEHDNGQSQGAGGGASPGGTTASGEAAGQTIPGQGGPGTGSSVSRGPGGEIMSQAYGNSWSGVSGNVNFSSGINVADFSQRPSNSSFGVSATQNADYFRNMIIHNNPGSSAQGTLNYINKYDAGRGFSPGYHVVIDKNNVYYAAPPNVRTNGTDGNPIASNNNSLHVVVINENDPVSQATLKEFTQKVAVERLGISPNNVYGHGEVDRSNAGEMKSIAAQTRAGLDGTKTTTAPYSPDNLQKKGVSPTSSELNKPAASQPATSVGAGAPNNSKVVTPDKSTVNISRGNYTNITNASNPTIINPPKVSRPVVLQNATKVSGLSNTNTTVKYNPSTSIAQNVGPQSTTVTKPASISVTKTTTTQAGPMGTPVTTTSTKNIDVSSAAANQYLGRGGAQPVGADPALSNVKTPGQQPTGVFDSPNPADQAVTGATPAQEASSALNQTSGQAAASDIPAAPGGGNTGCFATGDNCERPADGGTGGAGGDTGANGQGPAENGPGDGYPEGVSRQQVEDEIRRQAIAKGMDPDKAVAVARSEGLNKYIGDNGYSGGPYQLYYGSKGGGGLGTQFTKQTGVNALTDRSFSSVQKQIDFSLEYAKRNGWQSAWYGARKIGVTGS